MAWGEVGWCSYSGRIEDLGNFGLVIVLYDYVFPIYSLILSLTTSQVLLFLSYQEDPELKKDDSSVISSSLGSCERENWL